MNKKSIWNDWGLWLLMLMNAYTIYHYLQYPNSIYTIMAVFWIQSAFIGIFNIIGMVAFKNKVNNFSSSNGQESPGCSAAFFAVHYGGFHLAYFFFVVFKMASVKGTDWLFIKLSFWAILFSNIMQFIQDKRHNETEPISMSAMFFMPYARILPMHLSILLPSLLHVHIGIVFLLLKVLADLIMHIIYRRVLFKPATETS